MGNPTEAGTAVFAPFAGTIHSFRDNANYFDYGPTIILQHSIADITFHTLYGHLSRESLLPLAVGNNIARGEQFASLGSSEVNGDWPPHLHFQIIIDMQENNGDYPGVATESAESFYRANCPDPNLLLRVA